MIKEILKPFDLEKAKAGAKLRASDGRDARIICFDRKFGGRNEIIALLTNPITKDEAYFSFSEKGIFGNDFYLQIVEEVEEPERWRDRKDATLYGYYINDSSRIISDDCRGGYSHDCSNRNIFATKKQAQSALAMAQISQIIANDKRFGGPLTDKDWLNDKKIKYSIRRFRSEIAKGMELNDFTPLAFHTNEQRNLFFEENQDLLKAYFML